MSMNANTFPSSFCVNYVIWINFNLDAVFRKGGKLLQCKQSQPD